MDALFLLLVSFIVLLNNAQFLIWIIGVGMLGFFVGAALGPWLAVHWQPRRVLAGFFVVALLLGMWSAFSNLPGPTRDRKTILDDSTPTNAQKVAEIEYDHGAFDGMPGRVARHRSPAAAGVGLLIGSVLGTAIVLRIRRTRRTTAKG